MRYLRLLRTALADVKAGLIMYLDQTSAILELSSVANVLPINAGRMAAGAAGRRKTTIAEGARWCSEQIKLGVHPGAIMDAVLPS